MLRAIFCFKVLGYCFQEQSIFFLVDRGGDGGGIGLHNFFLGGKDFLLHHTVSIILKVVCGS